MVPLAWHLEKPVLLASKNLHMENLELWKNLYTVAETYYMLAPWKWLYEDENFAIRIPHNDKLYFVSIMGAGGEHNAITAYEGIEGFSKFLDFSSNVEAYPPEIILMMPQVMLSFESNMNQVSKDQKAIMKALGLKPKGKFKIPFLTQTIPGFAPFTPEISVIEEFIIVLTQAMEIAKFLQKEPEALIYNTDNLDNTDDLDFYLVRKAKPTESSNDWYNEFEPFDLFIEGPPINWPTDKANQLAAMPTRGQVLEVDIKLLPMPMKEKGLKDFYATVLLIVDAASGIVLHYNLIKPTPSLDEAYAEIPSLVLEALIKLKIKPKTIKISSLVLEELFAETFEGIHINIEAVDYLETCSEAIDDMMRHFIRL
jgi:hypothetical protein